MLPMQTHPHLSPPLGVSHSHLGRVLVVEEPPSVAGHLERSLSEGGFITDLVPTWSDALRQVLSRHYELLIVALTLGESDPMAFLRAVREAGTDVPVLFVPSRGGNALVGEAKTHAATYPAEMTGVLPQAQTDLRDGQAGKGTRLHAADLELDLLRRQATRGGKPIDLTASEFTLLELLMRYAGEVLSHSLIASRIRKRLNSYSDVNAVRIAVHRLRAKIDDGFEPKLIQSARGVGYVLDAC